MRLNLNITTYCTLALIGFLFCVRPAYADDTADTQRLLLAIKQATISQKVAKASCMIAIAYERDKNITALKQNIAQFEETYRQIADRPDNALLLPTLREFAPLWERILFATSLTLEMPDLPGVDIEMMGALSDALLEKSNQVIQATYNNMEKSPFLNTVQHIALTGLLSQKSTKEFCYIAYDLFPALQRKNLATSIANFDALLRDLIDGNLEKEIIAAPNDDTLMNLYQMRTQWSLMRPVLLHMSEGGIPNHKDLQTIASLNHAVLDLSEEIATLFVTAYEEYKTKEAAPKENKKP